MFLFVSSLLSQPLPSHARSLDRTQLSQEFLPKCGCGVERGRANKLIEERTRIDKPCLVPCDQDAESSDRGEFPGVCFPLSLLLIDQNL